MAVEESVPTTQPFLPLLPSFPPSGTFPTGTPRVFQQSRESLGPIQLPQAPSRSFFWERAAHHTRNSKNKVDFGAPGIPARTRFIFPPPLPEVVPLEKEFRRKKSQNIDNDGPFPAPPCRNRWRERRSPGADSWEGGGIDGSSFVANQKSGIIGFPASGETNQGIHQLGQGHPFSRATRAWENLLGIGGKPSGSFQT